MTDLSPADRSFLFFRFAARRAESLEYTAYALQSRAPTRSNRLFAAAALSAGGGEFEARK